MRPYLRAANVKWGGLELSDVKEMAFTAAESETYELRPGDLLLGEASGSPSEVGKPGQYRGEIVGCCFQNTLLRVRFPDGLQPDFYEHFFREQALNGRFAAGSRGVGIHHLGAAALSDWEIPVAPQAEQVRIISAIEEAFSKLDAGEAGLRTVRQLLKRMREAVLAAAVTGRLVPQDPTDTPTTKLLAEHGVKPLGDDALVILPEAWAWTRVGDLLTKPLANGRSVRSQAGGFPVLRLTCLRGGRIDLSERKEGEWTGADAASFLVQRGDFLVSRGNGSLNLVGRGGLVDVEPDAVAYPDTLIRVHISTSVLDASMLAIWWNSPVVRRQLEAKARTTAGIYKVNQSMIADVRLPIPAREEQVRIVAEVDRQFSFIEACDRAIDAGLVRSAALRRSVLEAAFEGRLVPQDPSDEPASVLLERIHDQRLTAPSAKRRARQNA